MKNRHTSLLVCELYFACKSLKHVGRKQFGITGKIFRKSENQLLYIDRKAIKVILSAENEGDNYKQVKSPKYTSRKLLMYCLLDFGSYFIFRQKTAEANQAIRRSRASCSPLNGGISQRFVWIFETYP